MIQRFWPLDARLRFWHPVAPITRVTGKPLAIECCGVPIALFRNGDGGITAIYDRCAHRRMPLSHGVVGPEGVTCATRKLMARHYASTGVDVRVSCDSEPGGVGGAVAQRRRVSVFNNPPAMRSLRWKISQQVHGG